MIDEAAKPFGRLRPGAATIIIVQTKRNPLEPLMTRRVFSLSLCVTFLILVASMADEPKPPEGFVPLFNGKDLAGWKVYNGKMDVWGVDKGVLYCQGAGGGWLMTEKEYSDFEARLEFKLPKMGNSGFALRAPLMGAPHIDGMEIQIIDDPNWKDLKPTQHTGSIYGVVPPSKQVNKPFGEWNSMRIVCKGRQVSVEVNGENIVEANLDNYVKEFAKKQPGILRQKGVVGLQSYNFRVEFRNLFIKPL